MTADKSQPSVLSNLVLAKALSDKKDYGGKKDILRRVIKSDPSAFYVDSDDGAIVGLTHKLTGFRIHTTKDILQGLRLGEAGVVKQAAGSNLDSVLRSILSTGSPEAEQPAPVPIADLVAPSRLLGTRQRNKEYTPQQRRIQRMLDRDPNAVHVLSVKHGVADIRVGSKTMKVPADTFDDRSVPGLQEAIESGYDGDSLFGFMRSPAPAGLMQKDEWEREVPQAEFVVNTIADAISGGADISYATEVLRNTDKQLYPAVAASLFDIGKLPYTKFSASFLSKTQDGKYVVKPGSGEFLGELLDGGSTIPKLMANATAGNVPQRNALWSMNMQISDLATTAGPEHDALYNVLDTRYRAGTGQKPLDTLIKIVAQQQNADSSGTLVGNKLHAVNGIASTLGMESSIGGNVKNIKNMISTFSGGTIPSMLTSAATGVAGSVIGEKLNPTYGNRGSDFYAETGDLAPTPYDINYGVAADRSKNVVDILNNIANMSLNNRARLAVGGGMLSNMGKLTKLPFIQTAANNVNTASKLGISDAANSLLTKVTGRNILPKTFGTSVTPMQGLTRTWLAGQALDGASNIMPYVDPSIYVDKYNRTRKVYGKDGNPVANPFNATLRDAYTGQQTTTRPFLPNAQSFIMNGLVNPQVSSVVASKRWAEDYAGEFVRLQGILDRNQGLRTLPFRANKASRDPETGKKSQELYDAYVDAGLTAEGYNTPHMKKLVGENYFMPHPMERREKKTADSDLSPTVAHRLPVRYHRDRNIDVPTVKTPPTDNSIPVSSDRDIAPQLSHRLPFRRHRTIDAQPAPVKPITSNGIISGYPSSKRNIPTSSYHESVGVSPDWYVPKVKLPPELPEVAPPEASQPALASNTPLT